jgi:excisionase family DNA binding protein
VSETKLPNRLTVKEAAELLHVSTRTIHRYVKERLLNAVRLKHAYRIKVATLFKSFLGDVFSAKKRFRVADVANVADVASFFALTGWHPFSLRYTVPHHLGDVFFTTQTNV